MMTYSTNNKNEYLIATKCEDEANHNKYENEMIVGGPPFFICS